MPVFTEVTLHNGGAFVVSLTVEATAQNQPWSVKSGNFGSGSSHTVQVPSDATAITVEVHGEKFINDWKTLYKKEWPDTTAWPEGGLRLSTSGTAFKMHCGDNIGSVQPA